MTRALALPARSTLDFRSAELGARRRTALLVATFTAALALVVLFVYLVLLVALENLAPAALGPGAALSRPTLLLAVAGFISAVVGLGSGYHALRLSAGGGEAVALLLGGRVVERATTEPAERRLVNVVEEMAIAAGVPVPRLYVLDAEPGLNAFAAGYTPGHGAVAVTRGALERLDRDELQGVVAHELSHLLNADTRIDLRLMAAVGGLGILALLGRLALEYSPPRRRSREDRGNAIVLLLGIAFLVAGAFGVLCGKLVRFAVARQREWLADASAVRFTRNPDGLAGALAKVAAEGSAVASPYAVDAAHLFFAESGTGALAALFSTHPPIEERIRRIAPSSHFRLKLGKGPQEPPVTASRPSAAVAGIPALGDSAKSAPPPLAAPLAQEHVAHVHDLIANLPSGLLSAAREPFGARAIACALVLHGQREHAEQLAYLGRNDPSLGREAERLVREIEGLGPGARLALLGLALPALDGLSPAQGQALSADLGALGRTGGELTAFDLAVRRTVLRRLRRDAGAPPRPRYRSLDEAEPECLQLLSTLAWLGSRDPAAAQTALEAGARALGARQHWRLLERERFGLGSLDLTLERLDLATPEVKAQVLDACVATVLSDACVTWEEAELVRAVSAALGLPLPPVVMTPGPAPAPGRAG
ncbi:MAG TPA: M48 family metallopeptidase [Anaeromyxobacteraceae bacterium]|nr:M48 family metallopeptidase [Anaeromyxobacteraceae bacterium]